MGIKLTMDLEGAARETAPEALSLQLDALTQWNVVLMQRLLKEGHRIPLLYKSGVRYQRENYAAREENWRDFLSCLRHKGGDCEDLCAWRAAEIRVRQRQRARCVYRRTRRADGSTLYHILVESPSHSGHIEDPSRLLGM